MPNTPGLLGIYKNFGNECNEYTCRYIHTKNKLKLKYRKYSSKMFA